MVETEMLMCSARRRRELVGIDTVDGERDDAAAFDPEIVQHETRYRRELLPQRRRELGDARGNGVEPERERVVDRDAEPEAVGDTVLPALEPAGVVADRDVALGDPSRGVHVEERRLEAVDSAAAHVEHAGASGSAEVFSARRRQEVAAQRVDVDRELSRGLARVEQVGHARFTRRCRRPRPGSRAHFESGSTRSR